MRDLTALLTVTQDIAKEAGELLLFYYDKIDELEYKGVGDIVTQADKESEKFIKKRLDEECPGCSILGEEFGFSESDSEYCWAIDPLDGTANYAGRLPIFAVSIALLHQGKPILGLIFDPNCDRTFEATEGGGAYLNGSKISVNNRDRLDAISLFGVSTDIINRIPGYLRYVGKARSLGSAALHLCSVAAGYFDACLDINTSLWDVAAGSLILQEAGGLFTNHSGGPIFPLEASSPAYRSHPVPFLASNGRVHQQTIELITG